MKYFIGIMLSLFVFVGCASNTTVSDRPGIPEKLLVTQGSSIKHEVSQTEEETENKDETEGEKTLINNTETYVIELPRPNNPASSTPSSTQPLKISQKESGQNPSLGGEKLTVTKDQSASSKSEASDLVKTDSQEIPKDTLIAEAPITRPGLYSDGSYQAAAAGHAGIIEVEVTIENGVIKKIEVPVHVDTPNLAKNVFQVIAKEIISKQNTEVDSVTGATATSNGFKEAVKKALMNASAT